MNFQGNNVNNDCGCGNTWPYTQPTYQQCQQVVHTCNVQDIPHYINYHTHIVNNCVKRHVNVPTYSQSSENVLINEFVPNTFIPNQYPVNMGMNYPNDYMMGQYQGNVGTQYPNQMCNINPFER